MQHTSAFSSVIKISSEVERFCNDTPSKFTDRMTEVSKFLVTSSGYKKRALASILTIDRRRLLLLDSAATVLNTPAGIFTDTISMEPSTDIELLELRLYVRKRPSNVGADALIERTLIVKLLRVTVSSWPTETLMEAIVMSRAFRTLCYNWVGWGGEKSYGRQAAFICSTQYVTQFNSSEGEQSFFCTWWRPSWSKHCTLQLLHLSCYVNAHLHYCWSKAIAMSLYDIMLHNDKRSWRYTSYVLTHIAVLSANVRLSVLAKKDPDAPKTALRSFSAMSLICKYSREWK